jgi:hypothetical protein
VFCKSILHEFAVKTKTTWPSYTVAPQEKPITLSVASVLFNGSTYTGEAATYVTPILHQSAVPIREHVTTPPTRSLTTGLDTSLLGTGETKAIKLFKKMKTGCTHMTGHQQGESHHFH